MSQPQGRNPLVLPLIAVSAVAVLEAILLGVLMLRDRATQPLAAVVPHEVAAPVVAPSGTTPPPSPSEAHGTPAPVAPESSPVSTPARTTPTPTSAPAPAPRGKVGQRVDAGGFGITVEKQINEPQTYKDQVTIGPNERYLALLVFVENNTGGNAQLFPSQFILKDEQGFTYDQLGIHGTMPVLEWQTLGNRQSVRGHVDFVIPKSAKRLTLVYGDARDGSPPIQIDLGT